MQVKYLYINNYQYRIEYIPYNQNSLTDNYQSQFVMLRHFNYMNDIVSDDNIYFIEKSIFEKYQSYLLNNPTNQQNKNENNIIGFPSNQDNMFYSTSYKLFNDEMIDIDITDNLMVYDIYEKTIDENDPEKYIFNCANIKCDKINIYHPQIHLTRNFIVHIENVINNIHFHYFCRTINELYKEHETNNSDIINDKLKYLQNKYSLIRYYNSETEHRNNHNIYSEHVTCFIPNIKELFDRIIIDKDNYDYKLYFKENLYKSMNEHVFGKYSSSN